MIDAILSLAVSLIISLLLTPLLIIISKKNNILDIPNGRSIHINATPTLGGMAIYIASIVGISIFSNPDVIYMKIMTIVGLTVVEVMGVIDDIKNLSARFRLYVLIVLSIISSYGFMRFYSATALVSNNILQFLCFLFIALWIIYITNAMNFIDGIDGLASYITIISLFAFSILFVLQNRVEFALVICLSVLGAVLGFIPYNRHKALIFMGDAGSMMLGTVISFISIIFVAKSDNIHTTVCVLYILFVPIMEVFTSVLRRLIFQNSIFKPDKMHFHHLLSDRINNHIIVVMILSVIHLVFCLIGVLIFVYNLFIFGWLLLFIIILLLIILLYKSYFNMSKIIK